MKFATLLAALVAPATFAAALTINTPTNVVQCEPTKFEWSGGEAPYYLSLIPAKQTSATPFQQFPPTSDTSVSWVVTLAAGTSFNVALKDSTGQIAYSDTAVVQPGSTSCSGASASAGGSSSPTSASGSSSPSSSASSTGGSSPSATSGSGSASSTTASGSSSAANPTSTNGAGRVGLPSALCVVAVMSLVGAALF